MSILLEEMFPGSTFGPNCKVSARSTLIDCILGEEVTIEDDCFLEKVIIGNFVKIGTDCTIQDGVRICNDTIIKNNVHIENDAYIGEKIKIEARVEIPASANIIENIPVGWRCNVGRISTNPYNIYVGGPTLISIGCEIHSIFEWLDNYIPIGLRHHLSYDNIERYHHYLLALNAELKLYNYHYGFLEKEYANNPIKII